MKSQILALPFSVLLQLGNTQADDRLYLYTECSPGQQCIDLAYTDGKTESALATPVQIFAKGDIKKARVQMDANLPPALKIELCDEASRKLEKITGEYRGKRLMVVFDNKILMAPMVRTPIPDGRLMINCGSTEQNPFWESTPWLQELIKESSRAGGRSITIYMIVALAVSISVFAFILIPRMKHARHSDSE